MLAYVKVRCWKCGGQVDDDAECAGCGRIYCTQCQIDHDCPEIEVIAKAPVVVNGDTLDLVAAVLLEATR